MAYNIAKALAVSGALAANTAYAHADDKGLVDRIYLASPGSFSRQVEPRAALELASLGENGCGGNCVDITRYTPDDQAQVQCRKPDIFIGLSVQECYSTARRKAGTGADDNAIITIIDSSRAKPTRHGDSTIRQLVYLNPIQAVIYDYGAAGISDGDYVKATWRSPHANEEVAKYFYFQNGLVERAIIYRHGWPHQEFYRHLQKPWHRLGIALGKGRYGIDGNQGIISRDGPGLEANAEKAAGRLKQSIADSLEKLSRIE